MSKHLSKSKDEIKNRMMQNAAMLWDIQDIFAMDPVVTLMVDALASEIYMLQAEMADRSVRSLEKIVQHLTPSGSLTAQTAHAILQASPMDAQEIVGKTMRFDVKQISPQLKAQNVKSLSFSPVCEVQLNKINIPHIICGKNIYENHANAYKSIRSRATTHHKSMDNCIWVALDVDQAISQLNGLSFYFDLPNNDHQLAFYRHLAYTEWWIGKHAVAIKTGLSKQHGAESMHQADKPENVLNKHHVMAQSDKRIEDLYHMQFIHLLQVPELDHLEHETFPSEISSCFDPSVIDLFTEPLLWVKIKLPPILADVMDELQISLNAFPVANKYLNKKNYPLNILGLFALSFSDHESVLFVEQVTDSEGRGYTQIPYHTTNQHEVGTYFMKRGGLESIDQRGIVDLMIRILDHLKEENAKAASATVASGLQRILEGIIDDLAVTNNQVMELNDTVRDAPCYLAINPIGNIAEQLISVDYWLTNAEHANNIHKGTQISVYQNDYKIDKLRLLTTTRGGKKAPTAANLMEVHKLSLSSHGTLYSIDDIETFCQQQLKGKIDAVEVKCGCAVSTLPNQGIIRTLDVHLTPNKYHTDYFKDTRALHELAWEMERISAPNSNYRIFVEN